jgi:hypothetical protein
MVLGPTQPPNQPLLPGGKAEGATRLRMNGVIPLLFLYAFMAWTETIFYGAHNKRRLFPHTAVTNWFLEQRRNVFTARYESYL